MSPAREPAGLIGLGLSGSWIVLEPSHSGNASEFDDVIRRRALSASMGAGGGTASEVAPPMLIRDLRTGQAVGTVDNHSQPGAICVVEIYMDLDRRRAGSGMEAITLYVSHLFDEGARLVTAEVLAFNSPMIHLLHTLKFEPQARLREHVFVAGRFWDLVVYSWDQAEWVDKVVNRYRDRLPGGRRLPSAIGIPKELG